MIQIKNSDITVATAQMARRIGISGRAQLTMQDVPLTSEFSTTEFTISDQKHIGISKYVITQKNEAVTGPTGTNIRYMSISPGDDMTVFEYFLPTFWIVFPAISTRYICLHGKSVYTYIKDRSTQDVYPIAVYNQPLDNEEIRVAAMGHLQADISLNTICYSLEKKIWVTNNVMPFNKNEWW